MRRKKHVENREQLVWAVNYVVEYLADEKQNWLGDLSRNHVWHAVRVLSERLWLENEPSKEEAAGFMLAAAKSSEQSAINNDDLTDDQLFNHRVEQAVAARLAARAEAESKPSPREETAAVDA
jgi:hypothetical protein